MAIPFNIPSDEETANQYRSMDELFAQLYQVLRQIMLQRPPPVVEEINVQITTGQATSTNDRVNGDAVVLPDVIPDASRLSDLPCPPLLDLVQSSHPTRPSRRRDVSTATPSTPLPPPRRGRRRRAAHQPPSAEDGAKGGVKEMTFECQAYPAYTAYRPQAKVEVRDNWSQVGEDLRRIADDFQTSIEALDRKPVDVTDGDQASNPKSVSTLLSLLVPSRPYTGSLWVTVIFILGWGVLQRAR